MYHISIYICAYVYISNICSYAGKSTIHPLRDAKVLKAKFTSEAKLPTASSPLPESPSCDSCHNLEKLDLGKFIFQNSHLSTFNGFRNRPETMVLEPFVQAFLPNIPTKEMKAGNQVFPPILTPHFSQSQFCSIIFQDVPHVSMFFPIFHDIFWCQGLGTCWRNPSWPSWQPLAGPWPQQSRAKSDRAFRCAKPKQGVQCQGPK